MKLMGLPFIIRTLTTTEGFPVSDYFGNKSDAIVTLGRPVTSTQIFATDDVHIYEWSFLAELGLVPRSAVLEAVVLTNGKITFYT